MKNSLKIKLIMIFSGIILMTGTITAVVGTLLISRGVINQVQDKVRNDLNTARKIVNDRVADLQKTLYLSSLRTCLRTEYAPGDTQGLESLKACLEEVRKLGNMEMTAMTDREGKVIWRAHNPERSGDDQSRAQIVDRVLTTRKMASGLVIVPRSRLKQEGSRFSERAHIRFIDTPKAKERAEHEETAGLVLRAAVPVWSKAGEFVGVLYGGDLINRDYRIVDDIKNTVYRGETYEGLDMGTATIFQKDLRISTNVMTGGGQRAIGTRVSEEVYDRVIGQGLQWIDRAFVVNAWYVSAYEPLRDFEGQIVGILYVGMLEQKFVDIRRKALLIFLGVTLLGMLLVLVVSNFFADTITRPVKYLVKTSKKISGGDFSVKVLPRSKDELGELEKAFSSMAAGLQRRDEELKKKTYRQLMRSEKMAALGQLAAAMAHSIRNPLTSIKMRLFSMGRRLEPEGKAQEDLEVVSHEMDNIESIVSSFLEFSRPPKMKTQVLSPSDVVDMALQLLKPRIDAHGIELKLSRPEGRLPPAALDPEQLKEVFVNIILNGCEAMGWGGTMTLSETVEAPGQMDQVAAISIRDSGPGIPESERESIFQPFFSTKDEGSGLGLSIAARIVEEHGGRIDVEPAGERGADLKIRIPTGHFENDQNSDS